jgi:hypothetical protein
MVIFFCTPAGSVVAVSVFMGEMREQTGTAYTRRCRGYLRSSPPIAESIENQNFLEKIIYTATGRGLARDFVAIQVDRLKAVD